MSKEKLVEFCDVKLSYGKKIVFEKLNFSINQGDFLSIVGSNGSGKTTILRSIMGLLRPASGRIVKTKPLRFGYCKQRQFVDTLFPFTAYEIVMMARINLIGYLKKPSSFDCKKCLRAMETAGIASLASQRFYNLSGGQKQRVLIARALALEPDFLILDEPTTDLDLKAEREILGLITGIHKESKSLTIALVSHEFNEFINLADKFIFLKSSFIDKSYRREDLNEALLSQVFATPVILREVEGKKFIF